MKAVVVGAGLGGLSAALHLALGGAQVEVWEKESGPGGKATERRLDTPRGPFRWDAGPSLITMPHILDRIFARAGADRREMLPLEAVAPTCRYLWSDGTRIDEDAAFFARPDVAALLRHARGIHDLAADAFLSRLPGDWWRAISSRTVRALRHLPKVATLQTLAGLNQRFFEEPHVRQIFDRFATYNGSSPFLTPATFAIIPFVEAEFGAWYPRGGIARLPEALLQLAVAHGVRFQFNREVRDLTAIETDVCICAADAIAARTHLIPHDPGLRALQRPELSCSGAVLWLAVQREFPELSHHNILFSDDYRAEFDALFRDRVMPDPPTIYIAITSKSDPRDAPAQCENWFVLVNAPARTDLDLTPLLPAVRRRLGAFGLELRDADLLHAEAFGPADFARRDGAWQGSLYGWASHSPWTALFRPPTRHPRYRHIYFTGGTVHPGGGIPLVLESGRMVAERALKETKVR